MNIAKLVPIKSRKSVLPVVVAAATLLAAPAFADTTVDPVDTTLALAGISALKTAILAIIVALIGYYSSMFAVNKVMSFLKRKSGVS